jgi:methionyl-tRNA synthetase
MIQSGVAGVGSDAQTLKITDVSPLALADDFGVDPLRYHLLREVPLGGDGDFSYEGIVARYNADLANNLGNLVSRVATVVHSKCGGVGPAPEPGSSLATTAADVLAASSGAWARWAPHEALEATGGSSERPTPSWKRASPGRWMWARRSMPSSATRSRSCG